MIKAVRKFFHTLNVQVIKNRESQENYANDFNMYQFVPEELEFHMQQYQPIPQSVYLVYPL